MRGAGSGSRVPLRALWRRVRERVERGIPLRRWKTRNHQLHHSWGQANDGGCNVGTRRTIRVRSTLFRERSAWLSVILCRRLVLVLVMAEVVSRLASFMRAIGANHAPAELENERSKHDE